MKFPMEPITEIIAKHVLCFVFILRHKGVTLSKYQPIFILFFSPPVCMHGGLICITFCTALLDI